MKLIFVYNADSGLLNAIKDAFHKTFLPQTYPCSLCALTYGSVSENSLWKDFHQQSNVDMEFLHIDEFEDKYSPQETYPVVLKKEHDLVTVMSSEQLNKLNNLEQLIDQIKIIIS